MNSLPAAPASFKPTACPPTPPVRPGRWLHPLALGALCLLAAGSAWAEGSVIDGTEEELRAALDGGGLVTFETDCTITLTNSLIIDAEETILDANGNDVTISGGNSLQPFMVKSNASLTLLGLKIIKGRNATGGGLYVCKGATVVLSNCTFSGNSALGRNGIAGLTGANNTAGNGGNGGPGLVGTAALGGAIYNLGDLTLMDCTLLTNNATGGNGGSGGNGGNGGGSLGMGGNGGNGAVGAFAYGGAICHQGTSLLLSNCTFTANTVLGGNGGAGGTNGTGAKAGLSGSGAPGAAGHGAGLYSSQPITVVNCTFSGNAARAGNSADGGPAYGTGIAGPNGPNSGGGAICCLGGGALTNCTFYTNTATGGNAGDGGSGAGTFPMGGDGGKGGDGWGGGLYNNGAAISVVNCTFWKCGAFGGTNGVGGSGNPAGSTGLSGIGYGGDVANGTGSFTLLNTILGASTGGATGFGAFKGGFNLSADIVAYGANSLKNTNPKLLDLANNGGSTPTLALMTNSPAIDAGNDAAAPECDQRGTMRPISRKTDIGAFELGYLCAGQITTNNHGFAGVTVTVGTNTLTTDADGQFSLYLLPGSYTVKPVFAGYGFSPTESALQLTSDTNLAFSAVPLFAITGRVQEGSLGLSNVTVKTGSNTTTTDADGNYSFLLPKGTYTLTPTRTGYQFSPANVTVAIGPAATNGVNFAATAIFNLSGAIAEGTNGLGGVKVTLTGTNTTNVVTTAASGAYSLAGLYAGTYTITPTLSCYHFDLPSRQVTVGPSTNGQNFAATHDAYTIAGRLMAGTEALGGATVTAAGQTVKTDTNGYYALSGLCAGTYTAVPSLAGYQFQPASLPLTVGPDATGANFTGISVYSLSGRVLANSNGLGAVTITVASSTTTNRGTTDALGFYSVGGLPAGTYSVSPALGCYHFKVPSRSVTISGNSTNCNFEAIHDAYTLSGRLMAGTNPVSGASVLVGTTNVQTDTNGYYAVTGLCAGAYTILPVQGCYQFTPALFSTNLVSEDVTNVDFSAVHGYVVRGQITEGSVGLRDITVQAGTNSATTDATGTYTLLTMCPGTYTVTPTQACHLFYPPSRPITVGPDMLKVDFVAYTNDVLTLRGKITSGTNGAALAGVTVRANDRFAQTDATGAYVFTHLCPGAYVLEPVLNGYGFTPATRNLTLAQDTSGVNFDAYGGYSISGRITNGVAGITVTALNSGRSALTDSNGSYTITGVPTNLTVKVTPVLGCYQFTPPVQEVTVYSNNAPEINFTASHDVYVLSGRITEGGVGLSNVLVQAGNQTTNTDANGNYAFTGLCPNTYTIMPVLACYQFNPAFRSATLGPNATSLDFVAFATRFTIRGRVTEGTNLLSDVQLSLSGHSATSTDVNGTYVLDNLCPDSYTLTPLLGGYEFQPASVPVNLTGDTNGLDFSARAILRLARTNGVVYLSAPATNGLSYRLEASTNLTWWQGLVTNKVPILNYPDTEATNQPLRFYRMKR